MKIRMVSKCSEGYFPNLTQLMVLPNVILFSLISVAGIPSSGIVTYMRTLIRQTGSHGSFPGFRAMCISDRWWTYQI